MNNRKKYLVREYTLETDLEQALNDMWDNGYKRINMRIYDAVAVVVFEDFAKEHLIFQYHRYPLMGWNSLLGLGLSKQGSDNIGLEGTAFKEEEILEMYRKKGFEIHEDDTTYGNLCSLFENEPISLYFASNIAQKLSQSQKT